MVGLDDLELVDPDGSPYWGSLDGPAVGLMREELDESRELSWGCSGDEVGWRPSGRRGWLVGREDRLVVGESGPVDKGKRVAGQLMYDDQLERRARLWSDPSALTPAGSRRLTGSKDAQHMRSQP